MKLKEYTKFVFIAISSVQNESQNDVDRFVSDISIVVRILEKKGVDKGNIEIVSDWKEDVWSNHNLQDIKRELPQDACGSIRNIDCENLFIIVSCHGGLDGIGENGIIRPHNLIESIKGNATLQNCVVLFGQCFAGTFNYSNVDDPQKKIVYIGATGLRSGVSAGMHYVSAPDIDITWTANVFVYHLAKWFENPQDVNDDGVYSVMDMYKYVTCQTNAVTQQVEKLVNKQYLETKVKLEYKKQQNKGVLDPNSQLEEIANDKLMDSIFLHQECWILNAAVASIMLIEF